MPRFSILALALLAWVAAALPAAAQRGGTPGEFDFYVLALSWSPGYCDSDRGGRSAQCEPGRKLGFVVHGLWPQFERGYPSSCRSGSNPSSRVLDEIRDLYPDSGLARHEWRTHGTCSGLPPAEYFAAVRRARDKVAIPDPLVGMERGGETTPQNLERAFAAVNPGLRPDMMSVTCSRSALREVRVCLDRDLRNFRPCPEVDRNACRFGPIQIGAPR